jgi:uracil-DNA glycosylase
MTYEFDPGYGAEPFKTLVENYPGSDVYPEKAFRVEWGPIFHRGRLDGSARVLVVGQDPAQHETVIRRILVGEAGERAQGFLAKLGIDRSYALINAFLYSVYGSASSHNDDEPLVAYRNRWIQAILETQQIEAVVCLGDLAATAWDLWLQSGGREVPRVKIWHPTRPESSSRNKPRGELARQTQLMLDNWNAGLEAIMPSIAHPDRDVALVPYGDSFQPGDKVPIPACDVPPGLPPWMIAADGWARRGLPAPPKEPLEGDALDLQKRATLVITVPKPALPNA